MLSLMAKIWPIVKLKEVNERLCPFNSTCDIRYNPITISGCQTKNSVLILISAAAPLPTFAFEWIHPHLCSLLPEVTAAHFGTRAVCRQRIQISESSIVGFLQTKTNRMVLVKRMTTAANKSKGSGLRLQRYAVFSSEEASCSLTKSSTATINHLQTVKTEWAPNATLATMRRCPSFTLRTCPSPSPSPSFHPSTVQGTALFLKRHKKKPQPQGEENKKEDRDGTVAFKCYEILKRA